VSGASQDQFGRPWNTSQHVHLHGGPRPGAEVPAQLIDLVWSGKINPGKVFDLSPHLQMHDGPAHRDVEPNPTISPIAPSRPIAVASIRSSSGVTYDSRTHSSKVCNVQILSPSLILRATHSTGAYCYPGARGLTALSHDDAVRLANGLRAAIAKTASIRS
jgi:hypothetical protein